MKKTEIIPLVFILLLSALLSACLLTRGHLWWDDFASYIMQAQSLLHGAPREFIAHNTFTISNSTVPPGPIAYPWGFPVLLAPVLAIFGMKLLALKALNTIFFLLFLIVFQRMARLRLPVSGSLFLTAILAFNPALLAAHDLILSDIPFLFFSTLAILLIESGDKRPWLTGGVIFAAFTLRTNGLLLLVPLAVAQAMRFRAWSEARQNWRVILAPYFAFGMLTALLYFLLPSGQESHFSHYATLTLGHVWANALYYLSLPAELFKDVPYGSAFSALIGILFLVGIITSPRKNWIVLSYIIVTMGLYITWPETQGLRFLYPILPLGLLIAAEELQAGTEKLSARIKPLARWTGLGAAGALIVLSLTVSAQSGISNLQNGRAINGPFDPYSAEMFAFIREQTPTDSVIVFFRPRVMRLLTGRDSFLSLDCARIPPGDYLALSKKADDSLQSSAEQLAACHLPLTPVFENRRFIVYRVAE